MQKYQELQQIKEKMKKNEQVRALSEDKAFIYDHHKKEKAKFVKLKNEEEKRKMSLTLYSRKKSIEEENRRAHDRIVWEESNSDRKKLFLQPENTFLTL